MVAKKVGKVNRFIAYMSFRKFTADYLFNGYQLLKDAVLITDDQGIVQDTVSLKDAGNDVRGSQGILTPGLINCHCHLELSHLKNMIPPHTGLIEFLCLLCKKEDLDRRSFRKRSLGGTGNVQ